MLKKILNIVGKIIVGIFAFYLFVCLLVVPFGTKWAVQSQGTKILRHPVRVHWVQFNPFLWRLSVYGFEILDASSQTMAGFNKFWVDVSFLKLFKKEYRVESVGLTGLKVNAALLADNRINLLELIPPSAAPAQQTPPAPPGNSPAGTAPLPLVIVDSLTLQDGTVRFVDQTVAPNFSTALSSINVEVSGFSTKPEGETKVVFSAKLDDKGSISVEALLKPLAQPLAIDTTFKLNNYALLVTTPYVGKYTGRAVGDGKLDLSMDYRIAENKLTASHKLLIQHFDFGKKVESKDALSLPFGLALALLEDPQGRISINLPVSGDMSDPEFHYFHLIGQVARNFFIKLVTKPFSFLASVISADSGTEDLGYVRFSPGKAELSDAEKEKLAVLVKGLKERPKLLLEIDGSFDPEVDWKAIKTEVFNNDYKKLTAESTRMEGWVYRLLYQRRFGVRALWELNNHYRSKNGVIDEAQMNTEIKRRIIEDAPPDKVALAVLAQTRAKVVYDFILAAGFDAERLSIGQNKSVQSSVGYVPLEFTLTVFGQTAEVPPSSGEPSSGDTGLPDRQALPSPVK